MKNLLSVLVITFLFGHSNSQPLETSSLDEQLNKLINTAYKDEYPGVVILASKSGKVIFKGAKGASDMENDVSLNCDQIFRLGSITKQFTSVAIMQLVEKGKISLTDFLHFYIPDFKELPPIKIEQLLNHTGGFGNQNDFKGWDSLQNNFTNYPEDIISTVSKVPLQFIPGEKYHYSNIGYILLGYLIEKVSGMAYEYYVEHYIIRPVGLKASGFEYAMDHSGLFTKGYSKVNQSFVHAADIDMRIPYAAGGLSATLSDLYTWNTALFSSKIISKAALQKCIEPAYLNNGERTNYGYGWQIGNIQGSRTLKHDGIINGFTSISIYIPEHDVFVAAFSNCDCYRDIEVFASKVAAVLLGEPFFENEQYSPNFEEMDMVAGTYSKNKSDIYISIEGSQLYYYTKGGTKHVLVPIEKGQYGVQGSLDQIYFTKNASGPSFTLQTLNISSDWTKTGELESIKCLSVSPKKLDQYIGKYNFEGQFVLELIRKDNRLFGQVGHDRHELFCYLDDKFFAKDMDARVEFSRDAGGLVTGLILHQGISREAKRIE